MLLGDIIPTRFWTKVDKNGPLWNDTPCWLWTGCTHKTKGYGYFQNGKTLVLAHRFAYENLVAPIPEGLTVDHLCRVRPCVNPEHFDIVTRGVNVLRGDGITARHARATHCPKEHPYDLSNTYTDKRGFRQCKKCTKIRQSTLAYKATRREYNKKRVAL